MEGLNQDLSEEEWQLPEGARPEVKGPNSAPTGSRFDTSTDNYAAGGPPVPVKSDSVIRAREARKRMIDTVTFEGFPEGLLGGRFASVPRTLAVSDRTDINATVREVLSGEIVSGEEPPSEPIL